MRGKVIGKLTAGASYRITPAYAGKSDSKSAAAMAGWDHPRLCGEKRLTECSAGGACGITPAYAGKRIKPLTVSDVQADHPRLCGEKFPFV